MESCALFLVPQPASAMVNGVKVAAAFIIGLAELAALAITVLVANSIHKCHSPPALLAVVVAGFICSGASGAILLVCGFYALLCCCKGSSKFFAKPWFLFLRPLVFYAISAGIYGVARYVVKPAKSCNSKNLHLFLLIGIPLFAAICVLSMLAFLFTCRERAEEEEELIDDRAPLTATPKKKPARV